MPLPEGYVPITQQGTGYFYPDEAGLDMEDAEGAEGVIASTMNYKEGGTHIISGRMCAMPRSRRHRRHSVEARHDCAARCHERRVGRVRRKLSRQPFCERRREIGVLGSKPIEEIAAIRGLVDVPRHLGPSAVSEGSAAGARVRTVSRVEHALNATVIMVHSCMFASPSFALH